MSGRWTCAHEVDVLDLAATGRWPDGADRPLRDHVTTCGVCADVALAAGAVADLREEACPPIPDAMTVWRRAERRAREEAVRTASRPLVTAWLVSGAVVLGVLAGWWSDAWPWLGRTWNRFVDMAPAPPVVPPLPGLWPPDVSAPVLWAVSLAAGGLALVPLALWIARIADGQNERHRRPSR